MNGVFRVTERIYFDSVKERGDTFFVKYSPPNPGVSFATLSITYSVVVNINDVIVELESQAKKWIDKYPVPVMVSAFDKFGNLMNLDKVKGSSHLIAFRQKGEIENHWKLLKDSEIPQDALNVQFLLSTYSDINSRTQSEVEKAALKKAKSMNHIKVILIVWAVFIPALIAILEFFSPVWVAALALAYSLWKAFQQWRLMTGRRNKSEKDIAKEKEDLRMRHHHYHCEQNPDSFLRLKLENFNRNAKERVRNEFNSIQKSN